MGYIQSRDPHSQRLMVARKHSAREIVELPFTPQTAVSLSGALMLVPTLFGDPVLVEVGTPHPLRPAMGADELKTLGVVQQVKQIHGHPILPLSNQLLETQEEPKEIAHTLGVSVSTVKFHVQDILEKLSASDRTQAAVKALRQGLL